MGEKRRVCSAPPCRRITHFGKATLHAALDRAAWAAYDWDDLKREETSDEDILRRLVALNHVRAGVPTTVRSSRTAP
jgi:hypothetical protein